MISRLISIFLWCDTHKVIAFDIVRFYLGIGLFFRGILFLMNPEILEVYMQSMDSFVVSMVLVHYIALAHLVGGICLSIGLFTRFVSLIQVPILLGAVFLINLSKELARSDSLELSAMVLFLLLLFSLFGSGPFSVDGYLKTHPSPEDDF